MKKSAYGSRIARFPEPSIRSGETFFPDFGNDGISLDTISGVASVTVLGGILGLDVSPHAAKIRIGTLEVEAK
jgi:hypothetical protein